MLNGMDRSDQIMALIILVECSGYIPGAEILSIDA
jgi:hypothetical protein